jgi:hypothetical protein
MAGANSNIQITDLDFNTIKTNLKRYLQSQDTLKDYNYEGSALSTLLDILAYNTQYNAYYLNMVANEMFLDSAIQRQSVVSHAKMLNYTPTSASAPAATINLRINQVTDVAVTLPKFTNFLSEAIDGVNYRFVTVNDTTVNANAFTQTAIFSNLTIKQGEPVSLSFTYDSVQNPSILFDLPDSTIDTSTLTVVVQQSSSNSSSEVYTLAHNFLELDSSSAVYFLQEGPNGNYQIYFGDGVLGKLLSDGNLVLVSYITTNGSASYRANNFVLMDPISGYSNTVITPITATTLGTEKETTDSIRYTATKSYSAQGRAVTKEDYIYQIQNNAGVIPIEAVNVWGGEENDPPVYGTVLVAIKPRGGYVLTETQKRIIETEIIRPISVLTVTPKLIDVDYTYLKITSNILYLPRLTTYSAAQLEGQVLSAIQTFGSSTLNTFNSTFKLSSLITSVQSVSPSFITNDASIILQKRFTPNLLTASSYTFNFDVPLKKDIYSGSITAFPTFQYRDSKNNNIVREFVYLEETPSSTSTIESISIVNPGFGYTSTPTVTIVGDGIGATATATVINNQVVSIEVTNAGSNYTQALVQIIGGGGSLASAYAVLTGNIGTLRTYYYDNGVKTVLDPNIGTVNYGTGFVTLNSFNPLEINNSTGVLSIQATPVSTIISSSRDKIITLDPADSDAININITAKI